MRGAPQTNTVIMSDNVPKIATPDTPEIFLQTSSPANGVESSAGLLIPESRDGFYGYNDEKSLQQVGCR